MTHLLYDEAQVAQAAHEVIRCLQMFNEEAVVLPHWEDLDEDYRQGTISSVRQAAAGMSPAEIHTLWVKAKTDAGWTYGEVKDPGAKTSPDIRLFRLLSYASVLKDNVFPVMVRLMSA